MGGSRGRQTRTPKSKGTTAAKPLGLRATDPESARVVAIFDDHDNIVGAGCLLSANHILTNAHVASVAERKGGWMSVELCGVQTRPRVRATVERLGQVNHPSVPDLALLRVEHGEHGVLNVRPVEFAAPLRHAGKTYSVLGFPKDGEDGRHSTGRLHGANAIGLLQMDSEGALTTQPGFSGAPVWCHELGAFVGLVLSGLENLKVAWCIPSRVICEFFPDLAVRFRIPPSDRPVIHDATEDDPNVDLFGTISDDGERQLTASIKRRHRSQRYSVRVVYKRIAGPPARGRFVTFITYPGFGIEGEDAYELFASFDAEGCAEQRFYPDGLFTVAAIGDGGDTVLTIDLEQVARDSDLR